MADCVLDGVERASKSRSSGFSVRDDSLLPLELPYNGVCFPKREMASDTMAYAFDEKSNLGALSYIALDFLLSRGCKTRSLFNIVINRIR